MPIFVSSVSVRMDTAINHSSTRTKHPRNLALSQPVLPADSGAAQPRRARDLRIMNCRSRGLFRYTFASLYMMAKS